MTTKQFWIGWLSSALAAHYLAPIGIVWVLMGVLITDSLVEARRDLEQP
jgi:hypothetical protein